MSLERRAGEAFRIDVEERRFDVFLSHHGADKDAVVGIAERLATVVSNPGSTPGTSPPGRPGSRGSWKPWVPPGPAPSSSAPTAWGTGPGRRWRWPRTGRPRTPPSASSWSSSPSPDGKTLATGSADGSVILWDVASSRRLGEPLTGHSLSVVDVAFSPDGKTLASGSVDGTVILRNKILWDEDIGPLKARLCGIVVAT